MAVYTHLGAEALGALIAEYDVGALVSAKGIAEGVSNSNWLIETTGFGCAGTGGAPFEGAPTRFILTMYEQRTEVTDLPFFLGLLDHLADHGCPVPRTIHDRAGASFRWVEGPENERKAVALIEFLPGVSVDTPTAAQAHAVGVALAKVHLASDSFGQVRRNALSLPEWQALLGDCGEAGLASIDPGLAPLVAGGLAALESAWPGEGDLPRSVIHADLFPDNVLMLGSEVTGLIDFYFACTDFTAYDVAVTHAAWCFSTDGRQFLPELSQALLAGYESLRRLLPAERAAMPVLAQGAAMRFLATRAYDWLHTPADAMVTRKDPLAFARRLEFYAAPGAAGIFAR